MLEAVLTISASLMLSLFLTPLMISLAKALRIYDVPDSRKRHSSPTPLLGGLAICVAAIASIAVFGTTPRLFAKPVLLLGGAGVAFMGMIDDMIHLCAKKRMAILVCIALIVFFGCIQFYFSGPGIMAQGDSFDRIVFGAYIIIWIVGITNAVNFMDGLDGLASFLSLISAIAFAVIFCVQGRITLVLTATLALTGAVAGFLPYNRSPAMVFMGDAGSMFIGFMLSLLSITSVAHESTVLAIVVPIYILFVPILDMCLAILRRLLMKRSVMQPDNSHFHHKLNTLFRDHLIVVIILSLVQTAFAAAGILIYMHRAYVLGWAAIVMTAAGAAVYTVITVKMSIRRAAGEGGA